MRYFLMFLVVTFLTTTTNVTAKSFKFGENKATFAFTGRVDRGLEKAFIYKITTTASPVLYVYLDSPGGSVQSLINMLDHLKGSKKKTVCVARFAASAAFMFFQHCTERYMFPGGIIMSHEASVQVSGNIKKVLSLLKLREKLLKRIDLSIADRMKLPYEEYIRLIKDDLWLDYNTAKKMNAVDGLGFVTCTKKLMKTIVGTRVRVSRCPVI